MYTHAYGLWKLFQLHQCRKALRQQTDVVSPRNAIIIPTWRTVSAFRCLQKQTAHTSDLVAAAIRTTEMNVLVSELSRDGSAKNTMISNPLQAAWTSTAHRISAHQSNTTIFDYSNWLVDSVCASIIATPFNCDTGWSNTVVYYMLMKSSQTQRELLRSIQFCRLMMTIFLGYREPTPSVGAKLNTAIGENSCVSVTPRTCVVVCLTCLRTEATKTKR